MSPINQDQSAYTTPVAPAAFPPLPLRNAPRPHPRRHPFEKKPSRLGLTQVSSSAPLVRSAWLSSRNWAQISPPATVTPLGPMGWAQPSPPAALTPAAGPDPSRRASPNRLSFQRISIRFPGSPCPRLRSTTTIMSWTCRNTRSKH